MTDLVVKCRRRLCIYSLLHATVSYCPVNADLGFMDGIVSWMCLVHGTACAVRHGRNNAAYMHLPSPSPIEGVTGSKIFGISANTIGS